MKLFSLIECTDGTLYTVYKLDQFKIRCKDKRTDCEVFKTWIEFGANRQIESIDQDQYWYFVEEFQEYFRTYGDIKTHIMLVQRKVKEEVMA